MNHVSILLDESGSMSGQEERVVSGINEYINKLKSDMGEEPCNIVINMFDSGHFRNHYTGKLKKIKKLTVKDYNPNAMTPLYDSVGKAISEISKMSKKKDKVIIIIDTDGHENSSFEFNQVQIKALIEKKEKKGWAFIFMATGLDVMSASGVAVGAGQMGLSADNTVVTSHAMRSAAYESNAIGSAKYFSGKADNKTLLAEDGDKKVK